MKNLMIVVATALFSLNAMADAPMLVCKASREGPRKDGRPGYELIDEKVIEQRIAPRLQTTNLIGATVKTYLNAQGLYVLVLGDHDLDSSTSTVGTIDSKSITLSLGGKGLSNFIKCEAK